jgi:hypothetical protein
MEWGFQFPSRAGVNYYKHVSGCAPITVFLSPTTMSFFKLSLAVSVALAGLVASQNANGTAASGELGIEAIEANFKQAAISGQGNLLPTFQPTALLTASFPDVGA